MKRIPVFALALLLVASALPIQSQDTLRRTTNYYSVTGASLPEIRQSLRRAHPWKNRSSLDGMTDWRIEWQFAVTPSSDGCRCTSFTTRTTITVTLPRWIPPTNAPPNLKQTWNRYLAALEKHEAGHVEMALAAVASQHKQVQQIGNWPHCETLRQKVDGLARQILDEFRRRDEEYDRLTQHGARQGAFLPGREGPRGRRRE